MLAGAVSAALLSAAFSPAPGVAEAPAAVIDPELAVRLADGAAPALLTWDPSLVTRGRVARYLEERGIAARVFERLPGALACATSLDIVRTLAGAPGALSVWGDRALETATDHSVPAAFAGDPNDVWQGLGVTGRGIGIAVIDTGLDATHPDLQSGSRTKVNLRVLLSHRDLIGGSSDPCLVQDMYSDPMQDSELTSGHGTHIAGVAAGDGTVSGGRYRGMAPGADLVGVGVGDTVNPGTHVVDEESAREVRVSLLGAIAAINYVLVNTIDGPLRVKVILAGWTQHDLYDPLNPLSWAVAVAYEFGVNVVVPAGNDGPEQSDCSAAATCHINAWAASPAAIAVAATPTRSRASLEDYSSRGDPLEHQVRWEVVRYEPTLAAPGTGVVAARRPGVALAAEAPGYSTLGAHGDGEIVVFDRRYVGMTGTSIAAAHVAGAIALMQQAALDARGCFLTSRQVKQILAATATPMEGYATWEAGAGALDATAAVLAGRTAPIIPPIDEFMCPPEGGS